MDSCRANPLTDFFWISSALITPTAGGPRMFPIGAAALPLQSASTSTMRLHAVPRMIPIGTAEEGMLLGLHFQKWLLHHVSEFKLSNSGHQTSFKQASAVERVIGMGGWRPQNRLAVVAVDGS